MEKFTLRNKVAIAASLIAFGLAPRCTQCGTRLHGQHPRLCASCEDAKRRDLSNGIANTNSTRET